MVEDDTGEAAGAHDGHELAYLQRTAREHRNVFTALMEGADGGGEGALAGAGQPRVI